MIPVVEMYVGCQGEGIYTGVKTLFVRFAGCNLAQNGTPCRYCDTPLAQLKSREDRLYTPEDLKEKVLEMAIFENVAMVSFTGGEPMMYWDEFKGELKFINHRIPTLIETNGSIPLSPFHEVLWSMDIKCPSSGNESTNLFDNIPMLGEKDQLKCVIGDRADYDYAIEAINGRAMLTNVVFQPSWEVLPLKELIEWVVQDKRNRYIRVMTQIHKQAYGNIGGV